jgi:hypothetical protein
MWVPSDRTLGIVVGLLSILILLLFFEPAFIMAPVYRVVDVFR